MFYYCGGLYAVLILWIAALNYIALPDCITPSAEQCLVYLSLTRNNLPLANEHVRSSLVNLNKFRSWSTSYSGKCCRMIAGDDCTLRQVKKVKPLSDDQFYAKFNSCASIRSELYNNYYVSQEEESFPLAYVLLTHSNPRILFKFLKGVYRQHNVYCIHYDQKSSPNFKSFIHLLSRCTDNMIIPTKIENVIWGGVSILNAQLNCYRDLLLYRSTVPWKYAFNLQGHELPLRTNRELVEMLQSQPANTSIVESWPIRDSVDRSRLTYRAHLLALPGTSVHVVVLSSERLPSLPSSLDLKIHKSWCFIAVTPEYVHYMLESELSKTLLNFLQNVSNAEEYFYATLYNHELTPGGRYQSGKGAHYNPSFAVSVCVWLQGVVNRKMYCHGSDSHEYCHFSVRDLKSLFSLFVNGELIEPFPVNNYGHGLSPAFVSGTKKAMFFNKYMTDTETTAMDCLEERLTMQNMLEYYFDHEE